MCEDDVSLVWKEEEREAKIGSEFSDISDKQIWIYRRVHGKEEIFQEIKAYESPYREKQDR